MLLGFVTTFLIQVNAPKLALAQWLGCIAFLAVFGSLAVTLIVGPILGGVPGSFPALWAALAGWVGICSLFARTMLAVVGRFAVVPTVAIIVILGIPRPEPRWAARSYRRSTARSEAGFRTALLQT